MVASDKGTALTARLDALGAAPSDGLAQAREAALGRLQAMGLPGRRDEYWRWTNPADLSAVAPRPVPGGEVPEVFSEVQRLRLVFTDGQFDAAASDDLTGQEGLEIIRLKDIAPGSWAQALYGQLEARGHTPVVRPFAALNSYGATDGLALRVTGQVRRPVHLIYRHARTDADPILHNLVLLEPGSELTLLETGPAGARFNKVLEVRVGAQARFHHVRVQGPDEAREAVTALYGEIASGALFKSFTLTVNGRLTRNEAVLWFDGDDAVAHVAGAAMGDGAGAGFHHDDTVFVTHDALRGESRQVFKKVLKGGAVGVFQGKILVQPGAQKTDGYQMSQSLLLDDQSQFLGKPELEIYADDVKCSHGSTTGAIDETALFYLRSRGVPEEQARALLVLSFLADAIDEIEDESLKDCIVAELQGWLDLHRD